KALDLHTYAGAEYSIPEGTVSERMIGIVADSAQQIWAVTEVGDLICRTASGAWLRLARPRYASGLFGEKTKLLVQGPYVWVRNRLGECYRVHQTTKQVEGPFLASPNLSEGSLYLHPQHGVLALGARGVEKFEETSQRFEPIWAELGTNLTFALLDYQGRMWLIGEDRKQFFLWHQGTKTDLTRSFFDPKDNTHLNFVFEDRSHNLWVCSNSGLFKISNEPNRFQQLLTPTQMDIANYIPSYRGMLEDAAGNIFVGGYSGLFRWDTQQQWQRLFDNTIPFSPYTLLEADADHLWVISEGYGLLKVDKRSGELTVMPDQSGTLDRFLKSGVRGPDSTLWLGGYQGIWTYHEPTGQFAKVSLPYGDEDVGNLPVNHLYMGRDRHLWVSTDKGLYECDAQRVLHYYGTQATATAALGTQIVNHVLEGPEGHIWMATGGWGVLRLHRENREVKYFTTFSGLADNTVAFGLYDEAGGLWFGTNVGLSYLNLETELFQHYFVIDGLTNNEFNKGSYLRTRDGRLLFGGVNGVNLAQPQPTNVPNSEAHRVQITQVEYLDRRDSLVQIESPQHIAEGLRLPAQTSYLLVSFALSDYLKPEKNRYAYQLAGYSDQWISLGEEHTLRLASLPHGEYQLNVRATGAKGNPAQSLVALPLYVPQIFYKTWWFITGVIVFVLAAVFLVLLQRLRRQRDLANMQLRIATDLHDDVGSALVGVAMKAEMLEEEVPSKLEGDMSEIAATCRKVLGNMRDVVWSIDARQSTLPDLFDKIREHVRQQFQSSTLAYQFRFGAGLEQIQISPQQKKELFFIVKEALANVLKHSTGTEVQVRAHKTDRKLTLEVWDNGTGVLPDSGPGLGLRNMQMRATRVGGTLECQTENGFLIRVQTRVGSPKGKIHGG
ncbi:MAG: triple tyrosine motif-containing protein, partial [Bacteroidota bacterium]